jgi:hypothetical protein
MYCSSCGVAVAEGLSYCKNCGAKLVGVKGGRDLTSPHVRPEMLVSAISALFIFGLVAITMLMGVMKVVLEMPVERVLAFSLVPLLLLLIVEGVFIRLLLSSKRGIAEAGNEGSLKGSRTKELDAAQPLGLPQPTPSVTEHTTRAFDPIYTDRNPKT